MKTKSLKHLVSVVSLSVLALGSPLMAQTQSDSGSSRTVQTEMNEPAGADDRGSSLWWLGLLGLLGLFGLKGRHAHDEQYRAGTAGTSRA